MTTSIILGVLMLYMMMASVACAIEAARQGGAANSVMLLSVLVTYGRKWLCPPVKISVCS
jgi:chitin synthase